MAAELSNNKTGTLWTAVGHIFCAIVGAGVLGLPNSLAWLGWVAGPICLCAFFAIIMCASLMLTKMYKVDGMEFSRYHHLVAHLLGRRGSIAVSIFQMINLVLSDIAYTITGAISMQTIAFFLGSQPTKQWQLSLIIGAMELVLSQIPSLEKIWWVSALGTFSSIGYVTIALGLGLAYSGNRLGSVGGRPGTSPANKAFGVLNALGNVAFAFGFTQVLLEIQDTLRQPPKAEKTMGKAVWVAVSGAFAFYLPSAVACYAALGNDVPGEVLQGFHQAPEWVMILANMCITIHMITAYQVWAQPVFESIESHFKAFRLRRQSQQEALEDWKEAKDASSTPRSHASQAGTGTAAVGGAAVAQHTHREAELESGLGAERSGAPAPKDQDGNPAAHDDRHAHHAHLHRASVGSLLGAEAMFHMDTGAADERVPLNDQGYLLPFWQRLLLRSAYVLLCTLVACIIPFFSSVIGLVGAVTFWPLAIGFPFSMYIQVFKPRGFILWLLYSVAAVMLLVCIAATIGSCQTIIVNWTTYKLFS